MSKLRENSHSRLYKNGEHSTSPEKINLQGTIVGARNPIKIDIYSLVEIIGNTFPGLNKYSSMQIKKIYTVASVTILPLFLLLASLDKNAHQENFKGLFFSFIPFWIIAILINKRQLPRKFEEYLNNFWIDNKDIPK